jgi:hypothetical protein
LVLLVAVNALVGLTWALLLILHSERFRKNRGPMPARATHILMWLLFVAGAALTFWGTQHGNTLLNQ